MSRQRKIALLFALGLTNPMLYELLGVSPVAHAAETIPVSDGDKCAWGSASFSSSCDRFDAESRAKIKRYVVAAHAQASKGNDCAWGDASFTDECVHYVTAERANIKRYIAAARAHETAASSVKPSHYLHAINLVTPAIHN